MYIRRDNIRGVTHHMHDGQYGQDTIEGMETFFEHWTKATPLVFVKYEALHDHLKNITEVLGVHFRRFPTHRPPKSHPPEDLPERLLVLRRQFDSSPTFSFVADAECLITFKQSTEVPK